MEGKEAPGANPHEQTANRKGSHGTAEHAGALTDHQSGGCIGFQDCSGFDFYTEFHMKCLTEQLSAKIK